MKDWLFLLFIGIGLGGLVIWFWDGPGSDRNTDLGSAILGGMIVAIAVLIAEQRFVKESEKRSLNLSIIAQQTLRGIDLKNLDLEDFHFGGKDLTEAKLNDSQLNKANLQNCTLIGANLQSADLTEANLRGANLGVKAELRADFTKTILSRANLDSANLYGAALNGTDLTEASLLRTNLKSAYLSKTEGLTLEQLETANGNADTILPNGLERPSWWETTEDGLLIPGKVYFNKKLKPILSLKVSEACFSEACWCSDRRTPHGMSLLLKQSEKKATEKESKEEAKIPEIQGLSFLEVHRVFDPYNPNFGEDLDNKSTEEAMPRDLAEWLHSHPRLIREEPTDEDIGSVIGRGMRVSVKPGSGDNIPLFHWINQREKSRWFGLEARHENYVIILEVEGKNVVIVIESPPDKFHTFYREARGVLQNVRWGAVATLQTPL